MTKSSGKTWRRILIAVLAVIGTSFLAVFLFYVVFFKRTARSSESQEELYGKLCSMVPGGSVESVSFSSDGRTLRGYWLHPEENDGILVFAMGREAKIGDHLAEASAFTEDGWNVFLYYETGCGASDGETMVGLAQGKTDLSSALSYIASLGMPDEESLVIYGHSMGAYATAAVSDEFPEIDGVVCVAGFETSPQLMISAAREKAGPIVYLGVPFIYLCEYVLFGDDAWDSASESLTASGVPAYLLQFENDPVIPKYADIVTHIENKKAPNAVCTRLEEPYSNNHNSAVLAGSNTMDSIVLFFSGCR